MSVNRVSPVNRIKQIVALLCLVLATAVGAQEPQEISDAEMAMGYYLPLAEHGEPYAQLTIGEIYMEGSGIEQNMVQAYAWFAVALHQGVEEAEAIMNHVLEELSEADQLEAKAIAAVYIQHYSAR
jgi:TPR repeat protein